MATYSKAYVIEQLKAVVEKVAIKDAELNETRRASYHAEREKVRRNRARARATIRALYEMPEGEMVAAVTEATNRFGNRPGALVAKLSYPDEPQKYDGTVTARTALRRIEALEGDSVSTTLLQQFGVLGLI